jgi:Protein of unknown function (DUF2867)
MDTQSDKAVVACDIPTASALDRSVIAAAYFCDSYRAPLRRPDADLPSVFFAIFGHRPAWMNALLIARNMVASWGGLATPTATEVLSPEIRPSYAVGDTIGPWPVFALNDTELIAGRDNKHLDFRLSILKETERAGAHVVISTVCTVHNWFGRLYLFFIVPFHAWGVQYLIRNAVLAGRL